MDPFVYRDILREKMLPHARKNMPKKWVYQQDNDPKYKSVLVREWFTKQKITVMEWPADLNPIENLWDEVDRRIRHQNYSNGDQLYEAIENAWKSIPQSVIAKFISSMKRRCEEMIRNKGYPTRY